MKTYQATTRLREYHSIKLTGVVMLAYCSFMIWAYDFAQSCFKAKDQMCISATDQFEVFNVIVLLSVVPLAAALTVCSFIFKQEAKQKNKLIPV